MWSTENSRFCERHIEKQPKISQNGLFSAAFWSKWQDSNLRSHRPERCAIPPSLHLDVVKIFDFFVSGQTCGQTEKLRTFKTSGEPKKSVFSRAFGSSRKFCTERGDWVPNVALYQTEPHLVIKLWRKRTCGLYVPNSRSKAIRGAGSRQACSPSLIPNWAHLDCLLLTPQ